MHDFDMTATTETTDARLSQAALAVYCTCMAMSVVGTMGLKTEGAAGEVS